jgi:hypothetical protein
MMHSVRCRKAWGGSAASPKGLPNAEKVVQPRSRAYRRSRGCRSSSARCPRRKGRRHYHFSQLCRDAARQPRGSGRSGPWPPRVRMASRRNQRMGRPDRQRTSMRSLPTVPETNPKFQSLLAKSARSAFHCARNSCHRSPVFRMRLEFSMIRFGPSPSLGPAVRFDLGFSSLGHRSLPFRMNRL